MQAALDKHAAVMILLVSCSLLHAVLAYIVDPHASSPVATTRLGWPWHLRRHFSNTSSPSSCRTTPSSSIFPRVISTSLGTFPVSPACLPPVLDICIAKARQSFRAVEQLTPTSLAFVDHFIHHPNKRLQALHENPRTASCGPSDQFAIRACCIVFECFHSQITSVSDTPNLQSSS